MVLGVDDLAVSGDAELLTRLGKVPAGGDLRLRAQLFYFEAALIGDDEQLAAFSAASVDDGPAIREAIRGDGGQLKVTGFVLFAVAVQALEQERPPGGGLSHGRLHEGAASGSG